MLTTIQDYLQTQTLPCPADEVAVAYATAQAVFQHAQAHIDTPLFASNGLPENLKPHLDILKQIFLVLDSVYSRQTVQTAAVYALWDETQLLCLAQIGKPIEADLLLNEQNMSTHLPVRTAQSGWANCVDDVTQWLKNGDLHGTHHARAHSQISLPICGEDGVVYGVLHLEHDCPLTQLDLANWVGVALALLPVLRELCPRNNDCIADPI